jgi:transposase
MSDLWNIVGELLPRTPQLVEKHAPRHVGLGHEDRGVGSIAAPAVLCRRHNPAMMGIKDRSFAVLPYNISLEELVPKENFYRRLQSTLDLSFVRDLVRPLYAGAGRPSVDPVVFFKLQLVMFFEDLRSERKLMSVVADRLSLRWYLGYDLGEPLPDHSSLTRIRERYGLSVFRRFFERIVEMCVEAGLVWGRNCTSMLPRSRPTLRLTRRGRARSLRTCTSAERSTWRRSSLNRDLSSKMHTLQGSPLWWDPRLRKDERWHRRTRASTIGLRRPVASRGR